MYSITGLTQNCTRVFVINDSSLIIRFIQHEKLHLLHNSDPLSAVVATPLAESLDFIFMRIEIIVYGEIKSTYFLNQSFCLYGPSNLHQILKIRFNIKY